MDEAKKKLSTVKPPEAERTGDSRKRGTSDITIHNNTPYTLTARFTGPESHTFVIAPQGSMEKTMKNGEYFCYASVSNPKVSPAAGPYEFHDSAETITYYIETRTYP